MTAPRMFSQAILHGMELVPPSDGGYRPPSNTGGHEIVRRKRSVLSTLLATKSIDTLVAQSENTEMHKTLGVWDLTAVGVGEIVGTGIFVLTGTAAADHAGPAVVISFLIAVSKESSPEPDK